MNFITTAAPAVPVTIDGTTHKVPRFLTPEFDEWVADYQKKKCDEAEAKLPDAESRARFRQFYDPPAIDIAWVAQQFTSPSGAAYLIRTCFAKAGISEEQIDGFVKNVDPLLVRQLADELRSGNGMISEQLQASGDPGMIGNPPIGQPRTSDGLPAITETTSPTSADSSPAATEAA